MSKLKHTPGPWEVENLNDLNIVIMPEQAKIGYGSKYATCGGMGASEEREADLKLIAAAPEMLECLIESFEFQYEILVKDINDKIGLAQFKDLMHKEIEIIEKATGMSIEEILK